jgi:hypothetical protein
MNGAGPIQIFVEKVEQVLLNDGWHVVVDHSFNVFPIEYNENGTSSNGFVAAKWKGTDGVLVICPLSSVLAVKYPTGVPGH